MLSRSTPTGTSPPRNSQSLTRARAAAGLRDSSAGACMFDVAARRGAAPARRRPPVSRRLLSRLHSSQISDVATNPHYPARTADYSQRCCHSVAHTTPTRLPPGCLRELEAACKINSQVDNSHVTEACDMCAGRLQHHLRVVGCTADDVSKYCEELSGRRRQSP